MSEHLQKFKEAQAAEMGGLFAEILPKIIKMLPLLKSQLTSNTKFLPKGKTALLGRNGNNDIVILQFDTPPTISEVIPADGVEVFDVDILIKNIFGVDIATPKGSEAKQTTPET